VRKKASSQNAKDFFVNASRSFARHFDFPVSIKPAAQAQQNSTTVNSQ
jgi:hypothetical protein